MVVPRAEESTVVLWAVAAGKGMGAVELERGLKPCFPFHERELFTPEKQEDVFTPRRGAGVEVYDILGHLIHYCKYRAENTLKYISKWQ